MTDFVAKIDCGSCKTELSVAEGDENHPVWHPTLPDLMRSGRIAVPNCGWFCSQACAETFESENKVRFARDQLGRINYYPKYLK